MLAGERPIVSETKKMIRAFLPEQKIGLFVHDAVKKEVIPEVPFYADRNFVLYLK
ncbi:MAG: hypothetical protein LBJ67_06515 [Planctomycetaceae bacterium]|nr:hypothetical protein [Planctomycetaceae bacterium]